jgi:GNAT superfamily N-acetyltransferase
MSSGERSGGQSVRTHSFLTFFASARSPGLAWDNKPLEIAFYGPEDGAAGKLLEKPPSRTSSSTAQDTSEGTPRKKVLGGLTGFTGMGLLFIKLLWVDDSLRGKGVGSQLMLKAEQVARERRCTKAFVK